MRRAGVAAGFALALAGYPVGCTATTAERTGAQALEPPRLPEVGGSRLGTGADLRFDGVYVSSEVQVSWGRYHDVLRLFRDGRVVKLAISGSASVHGTLTVLEGGHGQALGRYRVTGSTLRFTTRWEDVVVHHAATIVAGPEPRLLIASKAGSYGTQAEQIYSFLPIAAFE